MMRWLYAFAAGVAVTTSAHAQEKSFESQMRTVNASVDIPTQQAIDADALKTLKAIAQQKSLCIPTGVKMEKPTPATAVRIAVQGIQSGQLKNAWMAYGRAQGCAVAPRTRFVILLMANDEVRVRQVNHGDSIASMSLMRDTSAGAAVAALMAIKAIKPECDGKDMDMRETRVISRSTDLSPDFYGARYQGSWEEGWTFETCGQRAEVPVTFTADGSGGAYSKVKSAEVRLIN